MNNDLLNSTVSHTMSDLGIDKGRCYVIAEVGQAHDGSLGAAHAFIDAVADSGADAIKFQTHLAQAESTFDEPWRVNFSYQDDTRYAYWERMEFTVDQWYGLAKHSRDRELDFVSSPFSLDAVELLKDFELPFWKIASGEIYNPQLLNAVWATGQPVLLSSGMSTVADLDEVVSGCRTRNIPFGIFQCSSTYPTPPGLWGLGVLAELRERYRCPVGLSDHSGGFYAGLAAVAMGVDLLEVHVTFSRSAFGPDVASSVTMEELGILIEGVRQIGVAVKATEDKDSLTAHTVALRKTFGRSLALNQPLPAGSVLRSEDLVLKKPGTGIPYSERSKLFGRRLRCDKGVERLLQWGDIE